MYTRHGVIYFRYSSYTITQIGFRQCCGAEIIYFWLQLQPTLTIISAPAPAPAPATAIPYIGTLNYSKIVVLY